MLKNFFLLCSGADIPVLQQCSAGEQNKFVGIGATIFFTAVMAFLTASYALFTVFDTVYIAICFGLLWGLLVFNLDRFIVATMHKRDSFWQAFWQATPRLFMAIIIAVVIAKPLELKIFEKEINQLLLEKKNALFLANKEQIALQFTPQINAKQKEITELKNEILQKENEVNSLYATYISEAEGKAGTKLLGKGPVYKEKREKHDAALLALKQLQTRNEQKILEKENVIKKLQEQQEQQEIQTVPIVSNFDGLMARIEALETLPYLPSLFIFLLFLMVETAPIVTKLIASKSEYDYKVEANLYEVQMQTEMNMHRIQNIATTTKTTDTKLYDFLVSDEAFLEQKQKAVRKSMESYI